MAWAKGAGPTATVHHARRRRSRHASLPPVRGVSSDEPPHHTDLRDAYGRKIFDKPAGTVSDPDKDALDSLRGAWKPFSHWQRLQQAEQAEMAWLSSANATQDFDLDLTSQPGPLSQDPLAPPSNPANDPADPVTPETFQQGGLGQGTRRDPRRGPRRARQARWTAGDAAPKPVSGDWQRRLEEELLREEERAEQELADQKKAEWDAWEEQQRAAAATGAAAEAAAKEWADLEAAARAAAARAAQGHSEQHQSTTKATDARTDRDGPSCSQRSKQDQFKANAERAQRQQRVNAARQAKAAAEAAAARERKHAEEERSVAEHESLFQKFERAHDQESSPPTITLASIPMPPESNPLCLRPGASEKEKKAALRKASLRWHPDKFTQKFGRKIAAGQSEAIHAAVTSVFQSINEQREQI